jgi:hypothetical protein
MYLENCNDLNFCRAILSKVELSIMLSFIFGSCAELCLGLEKDK